LCSESCASSKKLFKTGAFDAYRYQVADDLRNVRDGREGASEKLVWNHKRNLQWQLLVSFHLQVANLKSHLGSIKVRRVVGRRLDGGLGNRVHGSPRGRANAMCRTR